MYVLDQNKYIDIQLNNYMNTCANPHKYSEQIEYPINSLISRHNNRTTLLIGSCYFTHRLGLAFREYLLLTPLGVFTIYTGL